MQVSPYNVRVEYTMVQCKFPPITFELGTLWYNASVPL